MSRAPLSVAPVQGALGAPGREQYQFPSYEDGVHWTDTLGPCSTRPLKRSELAELKAALSREDGSASSPPLSCCSSPGITPKAHDDSPAIVHSVIEELTLPESIMPAG